MAVRIHQSRAPAAFLVTALCLLLFKLPGFEARAPTASSSDQVDELKRVLLSSMGLDEEPRIDGGRPRLSAVPHYVERLYSEAIKPGRSSHPVPKEVEILRSPAKYSSGVSANLATGKTPIHA